MKQLCNYGCSREAIYQFKNGKWCCSRFVNQCPSRKAKELNPDEYRGYKRNKKKKDKSKKGLYKGYWCDSSWELAWVIYHIDHNIEFKRNTQKFQYIYRKRKYKWMPDFIKDGIFVEIKGWMTKRNKAKIDQFTLPLQVLQQKDLKDIFLYVKNTYGKDFTNLYQ